METITPTPVTPILPCQDGKLLHFLKELPAWLIIGIFVAAFLTVWQISHDDFIPRILDGLIGALLLSLQRVRNPNNPPKTPDENPFQPNL